VVALQDLRAGAQVDGLVPGKTVTIRSVQCHGAGSATITYADEAAGHVGEQLVFQSDEHRLRIVESARQWAFDGDGNHFRLAAEAQRIRLAYLYDPLMAVHTSNVEPLPHQIAAVYESMLPRLPLRFLLADDPGAGKTIMAGLLMKELMLRGDLERCLVVCPANLAEQWQDELSEKFGLEFDIVGRNDIEGSRTNNPFAERNLVIGRIDLLKQDDNLDRLRSVDWDLVVVDEAHKMSASYEPGTGDVKKTARYHLGELLGEHTNHLLLMTATPHSGKEESFQLFMALLDPDRFAGTGRHGSRHVDAAGMMRRMLKEELVGFDGRPLFPERTATTLNYELSTAETELYEAVTRYVSEEMNRAARVTAEEGGDRRRTVVGFALTTLQRRLASSPAAIHESLKRRLRRLEQKLQEARQGQDPALPEDDLLLRLRGRSTEDLEDDLDEEPEAEAQQIVDLATAARTVAELDKEVQSLRLLEALAKAVRDSPHDKKWDQLRAVLEFPEMFDLAGRRGKLVIFTEHRDTLTYLVHRIGGLLGRREAVVAIHGSLSREERRRAQTAFLTNEDVTVLVATDAAGEGVNLQRAHLMVNYDLPWNPNRIEQRFGRTHRFGQRETCHLWNLVAHQTREGAVYQRLFEKLEEERQALGGKVFDVLGRVFTEVALRELMLEAIRYNGSEEARAWATRTIESKWTPGFIRDLVEERALDSVTLTSERLRQIRDDMERAEARRLVPYFIESFFVAAFTELGGTLARRETGRYQVTHVPVALRHRERALGRLEPVQRVYERICFDRKDVHQDGKPPAIFVAPGHPLLDAVINVTLERYADVLKRGAVLVDDSDGAAGPRVLFTIESRVADGREGRDGGRRVISRRVEHVEVDAEGNAAAAGAAPYLDYRPLCDGERPYAAELLGAPWVRVDLETVARGHGIDTVVLPHLREVRDQRQAWVAKTQAAVRSRLTEEISYWDRRSEELREREEAGRRSRLNSGNARRRVEELEARLERRTGELDQERDIAAQPPIVQAGALIIPTRLLRSPDDGGGADAADTKEKQRIEAIAMAAVLRHERDAGRPVDDVSKLNRGWDIESREPDGRLRFIEVKGRELGAETVCVTKNELHTALNRRDRYFLAVVLVDEDDSTELHMLPDALHGDWSFALTSQNLSLKTLLGTA
jgi:superfamily II DNA or RNA helicase